ncbi:MAG TPA: hypothetical protein VN688_06990 [Gemmataceae bacterium]|nr:hypothetical protein [Gemmataceae bacterium]
MAQTRRTLPQPVPAVEPLVIGSGTLAAWLETSKATLFRMLAAGKIPRPMPFGQQPRWNAAEIRAWIAAGMPARAEWEARRKAGA